ncbi:prolipoprotein diacylglyceryl transferase, partial [Arthrobacter sp. A2-55]|uniref:prolipoprotein diacylglyceryl transferase n=1 Tax=Arthrobacter sp. A2-55 TaxID=2897337 RepID=UPI0021CD5FA0
PAPPPSPPVAEGRPVARSHRPKATAARHPASSRPGSQPTPPGAPGKPPGWDEIRAALAARQAPQQPSGTAATRPRTMPVSTPPPATDAGRTKTRAGTDREDNAPDTPPTRAQGPGGCAGRVDDLEPQILAATYWIDTTSWAGPPDLAIRFTGRRLGHPGQKSRETFEQVEEVANIVADTGRIAVTMRRQMTHVGSWQVTATPATGRGNGTTGTPATAWAATLPPADAVVKTRFGALAQGPGVHVLAWPALIALGALLAVFIQALLLARAGLDVAGPVLTDVAACLIGILGARLWFLALHRLPLRQLLTGGACIQGFLVGAFATLLAGALWQHLPLGTLLDASAPGLFLGMAVGRPGCFFTGCCYGRPTASGLGLWSSDRRTARRRHPVQLYEAAAALLIGAGALIAVLATPTGPSWATVFIVSVMAYTIARQLLFPLRTDPHTAKGRTATIAGCALITAAALAAALVG